MKATATILLLAILFVQVFNKWLIITRFNLQKSYITENLCENRSRPSMHCNGNCSLMKKMDQQDKSEKKEIPKTVEVNNIFLSSTSFFPVLNPLPSLFIIEYPDRKMKSSTHQPVIPLIPPSHRNHENDQLILQIIGKLNFST